MLVAKTSSFSDTSARGFVAAFTQKRLREEKHKNLKKKKKYFFENGRGPVQ